MFRTKTCTAFHHFQPTLGGVFATAKKHMSGTAISDLSFGAIMVPPSQAWLSD
jgi:hypothetical protein